VAALVEGVNPMRCDLGIRDEPACGRDPDG
jgi:hypothetical protein